MTHNELKEAVKAAMKNREEVRLSVLRGLLSAATNELVAKGRKPDGELADEELQSVISRAAKQRKDSIEQFRKGGREDLAGKEEAELAVLEALLPPQLSDNEIESAVREKAAALGATDKSKAGMLMGAVMKDLNGRADGNAVKAAVERLFA